MNYQYEKSIEELKILQKLKHPNIITPIEYSRIDQNLCIVTDYCEGGTLLEKILNQKIISEETCKDYIK